jgi:hypothetical protein
MEWFYSLHGQRNGPVSFTELEVLARGGKVTFETLVWREGFPDWVAYSTVASERPKNPVTALAEGPRAACAECGRIFEKGEMAAFENFYICASCKPQFVQKLREGVTTGAGAMWRSKRELVTSLNPILPPRCVKCNAPTETPPMKRNLYWHHPALYLVVLVNVIIYVIIAMLVRKRTVAMVSVCRRHRSARRNALLIGWGLELAALALVIGGAANEWTWMVLMGGGAFLGGLIYGLARGRLVFARKIDKEHVWMGGCGSEFLAQFPEWMEM